jgi:hypothetical protein
MYLLERHFRDFASLYHRFDSNMLTRMRFALLLAVMSAPFLRRRKASIANRKARTAWNAAQCGVNNSAITTSFTIGKAPERLALSEKLHG